MLGCIALVAGPGARLALLQPMLEPLGAQGGQAGLASGPELIAAVHQPGPGGLVNGMAGRLAGPAGAAAGVAGPGGQGGPAGGPVSSADGRWVLCFSGRLDNLAELRAALAAAGREPAGPGEPAAVLAAFLAWGEGAVRRLRGDFAFALADQSCGSVYLARDPLGGRPLYWSRWADCLLVASQVKSLVPAGQRVREVPPGQHGWAEPGAGCDLVPFADPPGLGAGLPPLGDPVLAAELIRDALRDAIAMRAVGGPLGVLVTGLGETGHRTGGPAGGGLAGAIIARLACEVRPDCVVLTPGPPGSPDVMLARRLAADLGLRHETVELRPGSRRRQRAAALEAIEVCELAGQVEITAAMTMLPLLRQAHDLGVPAVLAGHGAPELFGGNALTWPPQPAAWGPGPHSVPRQTRDRAAHPAPEPAGGKPADWADPELVAAGEAGQPASRVPTPKPVTWGAGPDRASRRARRRAANSPAPAHRGSGPARPPGMAEDPGQMADAGDRPAGGTGWSPGPARDQGLTASATGQGSGLARLPG